MRMIRAASLLVALGLSTASVYGQAVSKEESLLAGTEAPCAEPCGGRLYGGADYLLWWMKSTSVPPLVTGGNFNDAPIGALGQPGTQLLLGDQGI